MRSPSKVNLFLEVAGKRDDGFHELETVMLRTNFCDDMRFRCRRDDQVMLRLSRQSCSSVHEFFPLDNSNLIAKAAHALNEYTGLKRGVDVLVNKMIPAEAGLAGGSGNAATTLLALNKLWQLDLDRSCLHTIAASLGSDINFFLAEAPAAVCRGRGELVEPLCVGGRISVVAARPPRGNLTADVFSAIEKHDELRSVQETIAALQTGSPEAIGHAAFNRLTQAAAMLNPEMADLMVQMRQICGRPVIMSGSGSTCFVLGRTSREARVLRRRMSGLKTSFLACFDSF